MKKYNAPEAALVSYAAEHMMAVSLQVKNGTSGDVADTNFRTFDEDWDAE